MPRAEQSDHDYLLALRLRKLRDESIAANGSRNQQAAANQRIYYLLPLIEHARATYRQHGVADRTEAEAAECFNELRASDLARVNDLRIAVAQHQHANRIPDPPAFVNNQPIAI